MGLTREQATARIMVALDYPSGRQAEELLRQLEGVPCWMKVGMELFYAEGPRLVAELKDRGYRVFVDLKLHDIPNTVRGGIASLTRLGADMMNVHAAGGVAMMAAAREGLERGLVGRATASSDGSAGDSRHADGEPADAGGPSRPLLVAVTQLTSTSQETMNDEIGIPGSVEDAVVRYARLAKRAGLDGVVASPLEVRPVKAACGEAFVTVTPGIRPAGADKGDQVRVMTPEQAIAAGTDYLVIGRAITGAPDPRAAMEAILDACVAGVSA